MRLNEILTENVDVNFTDDISKQMSPDEVENLVKILRSGNRYAIQLRPGAIQIFYMHFYHHADQYLASEQLAQLAGGTVYTRILYS